MNIHKISRASLVAISAGLACVTAHALLAQEHDLAEATSAQLRAAYLECDRITAASLVDQGVMIACQRVAEALRDRDFGGDLELQLQWWRAARAAPGSYRGPDMLPAGTDGSRKTN